MIGFLKKYWLSILVNGAVLTVCMMQPPTIVAPPMTDFDKLVHFILFLGISGVLFFDNTSYLRKKISKIRIFLGSLVFPTIFGGTIEIMQATLTNSRSGDWRDFVFDTIGAATGIIICFLINLRLKKSA